MQPEKKWPDDYSREELLDCIRDIREEQAEMRREHKKELDLKQAELDRIRNKFAAYFFLFWALLALVVGLYVFRPK